jgi:P27 family predicted phage terminase small subunit
MLRVDPRTRTIAENSIASTADSLTEIPDWPIHLDDVAKEKWIEVCDELIKLKSLRSSDFALIEMYCQAWSTWIECSEIIQIEGMKLIDRMGKHYRNPLCQDKKNAVDEVRKIAESLGLSPTARTRIVAATTKPAANPASIPARARG